MHSKSDLHNSNFVFLLSFFIEGEIRFVLHSTCIRYRREHSRKVEEMLVKFCEKQKERLDKGWANNRYERIS